MPGELDVREVEHRLERLGATLRSELGARDVVPSVVATIRHPRPAAPPRSPRRVRRVALLVTAVLAATATTAWALRDVVFDTDTVTVHRVPPPAAAPPTANVDLGRPVGLDRARARPTFRQPHAAWLDGPPTAWIDARVPGQLSLTYPPDRAVPASASGLGVLVQVFAGDGHEVIRKFLTNGTDAQAVTIRGRPGVFLHGGDHTLFYLRADGSYATAAGRLVGNALVLDDGRYTVRIEADLPLPRLAELARSLRP